jgi:PKD repeat protein
VQDPYFSANSTTTATITVNQAPVADAGPDMSTIPDADITFNGYGSSDPDGTIVEYQWNLGDGTIINGASVTHSYASDGNYTVTLTVTDDNNATNSDQAQVTVMTVTQFETDLRSTWDTMKTTLLGGDVEGALVHFVPGNQDRYRDTFTALGNTKLTSIFSEIVEIRLYTVNESAAECGAIRIEKGKTYSYPITYVRDENGLWKILGF